MQIAGVFFLGVFNAWLYARKLRQRSHVWSAYLWVFANVGMWIWGVINYLNWIPSGRAWMWADFFGINFVGAAFTGTHALALFLFLAYPCFYLMGYDGGRMAFGRKSYEKGIWWGMAPLKKPKAGKENNLASAGLIAPVPKPEEDNK